MIMKEMEGVADRLAAGKIVGKERLALLRRQAELGDLRDAPGSPPLRLTASGARRPVAGTRP
jgi:hypothetical protein